MTERSRSSVRGWNTTPSSRSASPGSRPMSWPKIPMRPAWMPNSRVTSENNVLLPAPVRPSSAVQLADLDRLDHLLRNDIDDRNVVGYAVGHQQIFFIRGKRHVPDPLSDQKVFGDLMAGAIDDRDPVGGTKRDESGLAIFGHADADRLDCLAPHAGNAECDLAGNLAFCRVDDGHRASDLRGHPQLGAVTLEFGEAGPRIDQHVGDDLARRGVNEVRHVGGL